MYIVSTELLYSSAKKTWKTAKGKSNILSIQLSDYTDAKPGTLEIISKLFELDLERFMLTCENDHIYINPERIISIF